MKREIYVFFLVCLLGVLLNINSSAKSISEKVVKIKLIEDVKLTDEGLFFDGKKGINYQYNQRITPHGDCIDFMDGYVFLTWYKGGMEKRNLMLSRKKIGFGEFQTIEFPDSLIGHNGNTKRGDSHCTAAIGISPIDKTIHLIYDLHSRPERLFPNNYFNYRVSCKNAVSVVDSEWNISLFSNKMNKLNDAVSYERTTYPGFERLENGNLLLMLRFGGAGKGNNTFFMYDGNKWLDDYCEFNEGKDLPNNELYSIYGGFKYLNGQFHAGFSIRYFNNKKRSEGYELNSGLYYAYTSDLSLKKGWRNLYGNSVDLPIVNPSIVKIAEPCELGLGKRISTAPSWTVTGNGIKHFMCMVNDNSVHFYTTIHNKQKFIVEKCDSYGSLFPYENKVLMIGLENGKLFMKYTIEGTNKWKEIKLPFDNRTYRYSNVKVFGNLIIVYLMEKKTGECQPLYLKVYKLE